MRAMVLSQLAPIESAPLRLEEVKTPEPGEGELLLQVKACGICHTDLHTVEGDLPRVKLPVIPGHQVVGEVVKLGAGCSLYKPGDLAGVAWLYSTCGRCQFCLSNRENLCLEAQFTGYDVNGGYAEFIVVPEKFAYALPARAEAAELAPLLCAGIIGFRALRLSEVKRGGRLALIGFGASAHITLQVALYLGCEVFVFSRSEAHRRLAREMGASWAGTLVDTPPRPVDGVIVFAPAGEVVPRALEIVDKGGVVALAGITMSAIPPLNYEKHLYHEKILRSVANSTRQDGREFLEIAARIPVRAKVEQFPLKEANQALQRLKKGSINGAGVLIIE